MIDSTAYSLKTYTCVKIAANSLMRKNQYKKSHAS